MISAAQSCCQFLLLQKDVANFLETLTLGGLFRTLRKDFYQIYL